MTLAGLSAFSIRIARVLVPVDDIDLLAAQLIDNRIDSGAVDTNAGSYGIYVRVVGLNSHLGTGCLPHGRCILISTVPSRTSVTSDSNRRFTSSGWVRDTMIFGPLEVSFTSRM